MLMNASYFIYIYSKGGGDIGTEAVEIANVRGGDVNIKISLSFENFFVK
jgi:hypothetical protein